MLVCCFQDTRWRPLTHPRAGPHVSRAATSETVLISPLVGRSVDARLLEPTASVSVTLVMGLGNLSPIGQPVGLAEAGLLFPLARAKQFLSPQQNHPILTKTQSHAEEADGRVSGLGLSGVAQILDLSVAL